MTSRRIRHLLPLLAVIAVALTGIIAITAIATINLASAQDRQADPDPLAQFTRDWRSDPTWSDGQAEMAVYDATRIIYGKTRQYTATLYTDRELADPVTKTKSAADTGRAVFKHHLREDITTENYAYHYSTMCFIGVDDLKSLKLDMGSQEDCGATFKQYVNHTGTLTWDQFSYFPGEGHTHGQYAPSKDFAFQDGLSMILRGYPFDDPLNDPPNVGSPMTLQLLPDQTSNRATDAAPVRATVIYRGRQTLDLPIGRIEAHHLSVAVEGKVGDHHYWFAADGSPPLLHVMVQYEGPGGVSYHLRELRRWKYWQRN